MKSDSESKFSEAENIKQRLDYLRKIDKEKSFILKKNLLEEEVKFYIWKIKKIKIEVTQKEELKRLNEELEEKYLVLCKKYEDLEKNYKEQHNNELNILLEKFQKEYPESPKSSPEILNYNKILENLKKQKE